MAAYYIQTAVTLKYGHNQGYSDLMKGLMPIMARHGWKLALALQPMVGNFSSLTHIWEIESFDDIRRGLEACAADPEALAVLTPIPDLLENETISVMVKTPYSPE